MIEVARSSPPDPLIAAWIKRSLGGGAGISLEALRVLDFGVGSTSVVAPRFDNELTFDRFSDGRVVGTRDADVALDAYFAGRRAIGALLVEDAYGRRGDPGLGPATAVIADRLIHWLDLRGRSPAELVEAVRSGSAPWPLNAFLTEADSVGLGLGSELDISDRVDLVVQSVVAVIVGIFDGVTFVIWERPNPAPAPNRIRSWRRSLLYCVRETRGR